MAADNPRVTASHLTVLPLPLDHDRRDLEALTARSVRLALWPEIRIPVDDIDSIVEVESASGAEKPLAPHPYLHREGVNRCAACWQDRLHPSHTDTAVH